MANDKGWQRRSDEWVKAIHISRFLKESRSKKRREDKEIQDKLLNKPVINPENVLGDNKYYDSESIRGMCLRTIILRI